MPAPYVLQKSVATYPPVLNPRSCSGQCPGGSSSTAEAANTEEEDNELAPRVGAGIGTSRGDNDTHYYCR